MKSARLAWLSLFGVVLGGCSSKSDGATPSDSGTDLGLTDVSADSAEEPDEDTAPPPCLAAVDKGPWSLAIDGTSAKVRWESCFEKAGVLTFVAEGTTTKTTATATVKKTVITETNEQPLLGDADFAGTYYMNEVALTGLAPSTCYTYSIDVDVTATGRLCTARKPGESITFMALADTDPGLSVTPAMIAKAYEAKPDFTVHAGDVQYYSSYFETYQLWMQKMTPMLRNGGFFPAIGNHEDEKPGERVDYFDRFWGNAGFDGTADYYRFTSGGVWFFSLDTEQSVAPSSPQGIWLASQLVDAMKQPGYRFSIVFLHRPWLTCGDTGDDLPTHDAWQKAFTDAKVKLIIQGHMHGYERFDMGDHTALTVAGGGGLLGNVDAGKTRSECASRKASGAFFHTALIKIDATTLSGTVTDDKGAVRDTFSMTVP